MQRLEGSYLEILVRLEGEDGETVDDILLESGGGDGGGRLSSGFLPPRGRRRPLPGGRHKPVPGGRLVLLRALIVWLALPLLLHTLSPLSSPVALHALLGLAAALHARGCRRLANARSSGQHSHSGTAAVAGGTRTRGISVTSIFRLSSA